MYKQIRLNSVDAVREKVTHHANCTVYLVEYL